MDNISSYIFHCVLSFTLSTKVYLRDICYVYSPGKASHLHCMCKIMLFFNQKGKKLTRFKVHVVRHRFISRFMIWKSFSFALYVQNYAIFNQKGEKSTRFKVHVVRHRLISRFMIWKMWFSTEFSFK